MVDGAQWTRGCIAAFFTLCAGCGSLDGEGRTARNVLETDAPSQATGLTCAGAGWRSASQVVAAGFDASSLVLVNADGSRHAAHVFPITDGVLPGNRIAALSTSDGSITASAYEIDGSGSAVTVGETVRLRADGSLVWRLDGAATVASDAGMGAMLRGLPKIVRADGTTSDVPVPVYDSFTFLHAPDAEGWMEVQFSTYEHEMQIEHHGEVNLDGERFRKTPAPAPTPDWLTAGDWSLLVYDYVPSLLKYVPTGKADPVHMERLEPRRALPGLHCNPPTVLPDGRIGFGMRNGDTAGYFVGGASGTDWQQVGVSVRDVTAITGERIGTTWLLRGNSGRQQYCTPAEAFPENDAIPSGESLQLVADGHEAVAFTAAPFALPHVVVHSSGTCAYVENIEGVTSARLYDLDEERVEDTKALAHFAWLR